MSRSLWTAADRQRSRHRCPFENEPTEVGLPDRSVVMGTSEACVAKIRQIQAEMGINHFDASF